MTEALFRRSPRNPILVPREMWWEGKGVLNPAALMIRGRPHLLYRAVGNDGISRFGLAEGQTWNRFERRDLPVWEAREDDFDGRLGIEDPRAIVMDGSILVAYTKVSVDRADQPKLPWETAPFRLRAWIARSDDLQTFEEVGPVLPESNTKDLVLFPDRLDGRFVALVREFPAIQIITSSDLRSWSDPQSLLEPIPGTWEAERLGAGPPPIRTEKGWLLLYHANEYLRSPGNRRLYRMGVAILDARDPSQVRYRHSQPIFSPEAPYEREGPVGNVVFGTGLIVDGDTLHLYYGAGDGVIGEATASLRQLLALAD